MGHLPYLHRYGTNDAPDRFYIGNPCTQCTCHVITLCLYKHKQERYDTCWTVPMHQSLTAPQVCKHIACWKYTFIRYNTTVKCCYNLNTGTGYVQNVWVDAYCSWRIVNISIVDSDTHFWTWNCGVYAHRNSHEDRHCSDAMLVLHRGMVNITTTSKAYTLVILPQSCSNLQTGYQWFDCRPDVCACCHRCF